MSEPKKIQGYMNPSHNILLDEPRPIVRQVRCKNCGLVWGEEGFTYGIEVNCMKEYDYCSECEGKSLK